MIRRILYPCITPQNVILHGQVGDKEPFPGGTTATIVKLHTLNNVYDKRRVISTDWYDVHFSSQVIYGVQDMFTSMI